MCTSIPGLHDRTIQLKWHSLRRQADEAAVSRANLETGLEVGAVMEADIRLTRDGDWVCLHNATLDDETTGTGLVAQQSTTAVRALRMRTPSGLETDVAPVFLDELVDAVYRWSLSAGEVQLDLKVSAGELNDAVLERFKRDIGPLRGSFSLSGADADALARLRTAVPGIETTLSCSRQIGGARDQRQFEARAAAALARLDGLSMIWVNHRVLQAAYRMGFDLVAFAHERGVGVDTGTIDVGATGWRGALMLALQTDVDRITSNSPCELANQVGEWLKARPQPAVVA